MWWRREEQSREGSERGQASRLAGRGRDGLAQGSQAASACESFWITFLDQFGVRCRSSVSKEVSHSRKAVAELGGGVRSRVRQHMQCAASPQ